MVNYQNNNIRKLFNTVVEGGYCIGCGACAAFPNSSIRIKMNKYGCYQAKLDHSVASVYDSEINQLKVCPFSDECRNEDQIAQGLFGEKALYHKSIGYYLTTYAGYVKENAFRDHGSSGGMGTWILAELFKRKLVDTVIHVKQNNELSNDKILFQYVTSRSLEDIREGAKSRYYPIEMSQVLSFVRNQPGLYAIVGLPCFIKAIRLLAEQDELIRSRIRFCIGLICGHLKSSRFADMFAWQVGIKPGDLTAIDFRVKLAGRKASDYGIGVQGKINGKDKCVTQPTHLLYGSDWGLGLFKYKACDYCDDVFAETADITIGDAWLSKYVKDSLGNNVIVVRSLFIQNIIEDAIKKNILKFDLLKPHEMAWSQKGGLRHRRDYLAFRLWQKDKTEKWRPLKRIQPSTENMDRKTIKKIKYRIDISKQSHKSFLNAYKKGRFDVFTRQMDDYIEIYKALYQRPLWRRILSFVKRITLSIIDTFQQIFKAHI